MSKIIRVETEEEAIKLGRYLDKLGLKWNDGVRYTEKNGLKWGCYYDVQLGTFFNKLSKDVLSISVDDFVPNAADLYLNGITVANISKRLGISLKTVYNHLSAANVKLVEKKVARKNISFTAANLQKLEQLADGKNFSCVINKLIEEA